MALTDAGHALREQLERREQALTRLRDLMVPGSTVLMITRHTTRTKCAIVGFKYMGLHHIDISLTVAEASGRKYVDEYDGVDIGREDARTFVREALSWAVFSEPNQLQTEWM